VPAAAASIGFGAPALAPLAVFVLGGGALTRVGREIKEAAGAAEPHEGRRGVGNVAAKLGLPAILGLAAAAVHAGGGAGGAADSARLAVAYSAGLAAAFADTAATELGPLAGGAAHRIGATGLRRVPHGSPGAVSAAGLAASFGAAAVIGVVSILVGLTTPRGGAIAAACGVLAALAESIAASTGWGQRLGHHGRNAALSMTSVAISIWWTAHGV
jgi:uncharacterized protein (TIGR00297 family)